MRNPPGRRRGGGDDVFYRVSYLFVRCRLVASEGLQLKKGFLEKLHSVNFEPAKDFFFFFHMKLRLETKPYRHALSTVRRPFREQRKEELIGSV